MEIDIYIPNVVANKLEDTIPMEIDYVYYGDDKMEIDY